VGCAQNRKINLSQGSLLAQRENVLKHPVILDEVQKVPQLLDEVHWLMENRVLRFILCGSSARKLKRGHANLLGGRAWRYEMFPLVSAEIGKFDLLRALNHGLIPDHYLQDDCQKSLEAYVQDYLKEEVFAEGLTRNIPAFSRFFEAMAFSHGQLVNYSNIARDCGVDYKTVREYYQILIDTFLGVKVEPFNRRQSRQVISQAPKFYLFDVGVAGFLTKRVIKEERGEEFGRAFEHFILMEILAYRSYRSRGFDIHFWRTKSGLEVDFVLGKGEVALEVKGGRRMDNKDVRSLAAFTDEFNPKKSLLVCGEKQERLHGKTRVLPWQRFLELLWAGKIV
jgi:predicted AAA+ superfamily ATPase